MTDTKNETQKEEKIDITIAKGIAIFLVVAGHILAGGTSIGNEWFKFFVECLYLFHMPFFMFLSGYTALRYDRLVRITNNPSPFFKGQAIRLLIPFFFIGGMIVSGKIIMQNFIHVDNVPDNPILGFANLIWHTKNSPSVFLWYIYALFIYSVISIILFKFFKYKMHIWIFLSLLIYFIPPVYYFYLDKLTGNFLFFCLGGAAIKYNKEYLYYIIRKPIILISSILFFLSFILFYYHLLPDNICKLIAGTLSIPTFHGLSILLERNLKKASSLIILIGRKSYTIYLLNTISIGVSKGLIFRIIDWHHSNFYFIAPILILSGIIGPLIVEFLVLKHSSFISTQILGNSKNGKDSSRK